jgi:hypothetical protein
VLPFSGEVPAGTYGWVSFEPNLTLVIPAGWQVGHRHRDYFDLFPAAATSGGGPGVGFGRHAGVYGKDGPIPMATAAGVVATLKANPGMRVTDGGATQLLGLSGVAIQLRVDEAATPLFDGEGGAFKLDPGWVVQARFLDVEGGVLFVGIFGHDGDEAADMATAQPLLDGVSLVR